MSYQKVDAIIGGVNVSLETGRLAKQAGGAAVARIGDTMVLSTACAGNELPNSDFFPLTVEFIAKTYAAGKIPGGYFQARGKADRKRSAVRPHDRSGPCARSSPRPTRTNCRSSTPLFRPTTPTTLTRWRSPRPRAPCACRTFRSSCPLPQCASVPTTASSRCSPRLRKPRLAPCRLSSPARKIPS